MGTFSGAIYVRGSSREIVRDALDEITGETNLRFLLAPGVDGWVTVFPQDHGQNVNVAKELAKRVPGHLLHVILHDSDVLYYYYYCGGRLQDQYSSHPGYFDFAFGSKTSAEERESLRGRPELLIDILRGPEDIEALRRLLATERGNEFWSGDKRLRLFGEIVRLPYCGTAYEYLRKGHTKGIARWDEFIYIPDLAPELARQKAAEAVVEREFTWYREQGLLLRDEVPAPSSVISDPSAPRLVALRRDPGPAGETSIAVFQPPWPDVPGTLRFSGEAKPIGVAISPSGRYLAILQLAQDLSAALWELESNLLRWEARDVKGIRTVLFTTDEMALITTGQGIRVLSIEDGSCFRTIEFMGPSHSGAAAVHPSGALVIIEGGLHLAILDLATGERTKTFILDELDCVMPTQRELATQAQEEWQRNQEQMARETLSAEQFEKWKERAKHVCAESPRSVLCSVDGRLFFCLTANAVWVFEWETLLAAEGQTPRPLHRCCPRMENATCVCMALHPSGDLLLLGVEDGTIQQFDLGSGRNQVLLQMPEGFVVHQLGFSGDGTAVWVILRPRLREDFDGNRRPNRFQIWEYAKLGGGIA